MNSLKERISVARGEKKADIVLKNGQMVNVFTGEIYPTDVAIYKTHIAGIGDYSGVEEIDLNGRYITPGFIDAHLHIESTLLYPGELARAVVPHGTTAIISDPQGIANVLGAVGIKYLLEASQGLPLDILFTTPSNVPSIELEKGHVSGLLGKDSTAYAASGISSDHEITSLEEAKEKLRVGMQVFIREGSSAKNMEAILPLITPGNARFFSLCTDDIHPVDLAAGHVNKIIQKAVSLKLDPALTIQLATINTARYYNLQNYGAVAPGYFANINVVSNLEDFNVDMVFKNGKLVASRGRPLFDVKVKKKAGIRETIRVKPFEVEALRIRAKSDYAKAIELVSGQTQTKYIVVPVKKKKSQLVSDPDTDVLKLAVVERQKASGNIGLGLVKGFGLKKGALATSVAHDSHNIICVGVEDEDMLSAIRRVVKLGGGMGSCQGRIGVD